MSIVIIQIKISTIKMKKEGKVVLPFEHLAADYEAKTSHGIVTG